MAPSAPASRLRSGAKPKQQSLSKSRIARRHISYREDTSDSSEDDDYIGQNDFGIGPSRASASKLAPFTRTKDTRKRVVSSGRRNRSSAGEKKVKIAHNYDDAEQSQDRAEPIQGTGKSMPWATLPYQILTTIFDYASHPLVSDTFAPLPSVDWLLQAAFTCRAFAEPALSALYHSPPLTPPSRANALADHLATHHENPAFNYHAKIKHLEVEASGTLMHKYAGQDPINLGNLINLLPQLRGIGIHLLSDNPKFRKAASVKKLAGKPAYQQSMFSALQESKIMLRDWTWNQSLARQSCSLASLREIHNMAPYQSLQELIFLNYENGPLEDGRRREDILGEAISVLSNLKGLHFKMSSIVNSRLLPKLPDKLRTLELVDCSSLKSSALSNFLHSNGKSLSQLILDHNHGLNLSFLTTLGADCPKLEHLRMDLRYFTTFFTVRDSEPKYDSLFRDGEVPTWPTKLQCLELFHLRRWSLKMAEMFFASLIHAADSIPDLRQLKIKASLEESGWRERVGFRDKWTGRLQQIFQRKLAPPDPRLQSIQIWKASKKHMKVSKNRDSHADHSVAVNENLQSGGDCDAKMGRSEVPQAATRTDESDSDAPLSSVRRSTRVKQHKEQIYTLPEPSQSSQGQTHRRRKRKGSNDSSSEDSAVDDDGTDQTARLNAESAETPLYVQGMCDIVDVLIDNLRPTEEHLNEGDFLDEEISGDEDWNGDDDIPGDGGYAW